MVEPILNLNTTVTSRLNSMESKISTGIATGTERKIKIWFNKTEHYSGAIEPEYTIAGEGTYVYSNGDEYFGDFKNNEKEGIGEYIWADGTIYIGQWVKDKMHGYGKIINEKDDVEVYAQFYENKLVLGIKSGEITFPNEDRNYLNDKSFEIEETIITNIIKQVNGKVSKMNTMRVLPKSQRNIGIYKRMISGNTEGIESHPSLKEIISFKCLTCRNDSNTQNENECCKKLNKFARCLTIN